ncbi:MAG: YebC/PmpR family DNA-binding transcriptional regulator [Armatimonadetes bacterium]|nr:YebC/PmpR family DNA-binding transcriptional regulator [Armatimonadota bacterium]
MSGHSKWHNIRLKKGKMDAERGKIFTKLAREIIVAAKNGGGNPDSNLRLRLAVQKARENSMPQDNIQRNIKRGTGELEGTSYEEVTYEGYGPGGVAMIVSCLTDNRNRTVAEVRHLFSRAGGNLGETGCVSWMFDSKGVLSISKEASDEDTVMMTAIDAGAEDVRVEDETFDVITQLEDFQTVRQAFETAGIPVLSAEATMLPKNTVLAEGREADQVIRLMDSLEDNDDVQNVYANFDIPSQVLEAAAS